MSEDIQQLHRFAYKTFREILTDGYILFAKNWLKIIVPMALFSVISIIIKDLILPDLIWNQYLITSEVEIILNKDPYSITNADLQVLLRYLSLTFGMVIIDFIIGAFFTVLAMCSVSTYLLKKYKGLDVNFFQELKASFNSKLFIVLIIIGLVVPLGTILLIPGIILFKLFIFSIFTYRDEKIEKPLKEAKIIAKGSLWKLLGIFLITFGIPFIINLFIFQPLLDFAVSNATYTSWYDPITRNYLMIILYDLLYQLINILLIPLFVCFLTAFYRSLEAKKTIAYQYQIQPLQTRYRNLDVEKYKELPGDQINQKYKFESGLYCPYCGFFMEKKPERCPHCNESLDFEF